MIKNIVFDMAGVLMDFNPGNVIDHYHLSSGEARILLETVFDTQDWVLMDLGYVSDEEAIANARKKVPFQLADTAARCIRYWDLYNITPKEGMKGIVHRLHKERYNLYVLSNAHQRLTRIWRRRIPGAVCFTGALFSSEVHYIKPQKAMYQAFFDRFQLRPEECFLIDDHERNIRGAEEMGMKGYWFSNGQAETLENKLEELRILPEREKEE